MATSRMLSPHRPKSYYSKIADERHWVGESKLKIF